MSLRSNIEHLAAAQGIVAVLVQDPARERLFRGEARWERALAAAMDLKALTQEPTIRILTGGHTLVVQSEGDQTAAVALPTGHPVAKSLRRMVRRLARRVRPPLAEATPACGPEAHAGAPQSAPASAPRAAAPASFPAHGGGLLATPESTPLTR